MAEARQREMWNHTSSVMALLANAHRGKRATFSPEDFHPFSKRRTKKKGHISELKKLAPGGKLNVVHIPASEVRVQGGS